MTKVNIENFLTKYNISFRDNKSNNRENDIGRYTIYNSILNIFEPDKFDDRIQAYFSFDSDELLEDVIEQLINNDCTSTKLFAIMSLTSDKEIWTIDNEPVFNIIHNKLVAIGK